MSTFEQALPWIMLVACFIGVPLFIYFGGDGPAKRHERKRRLLVAVGGPFKRGLPMHVVILTCYVCGRSQAFADRRGDKWRLLIAWTKDSVGWRHWGCEG